LTHPLRLDPGERAALEVHGDFADQDDVPLPAEYLSFQSLDPLVGTVDARAAVTAVAAGSTAIVVSRGTVNAATSLAVGTPSDVTGLLPYAAGLDIFPDALTLAADGGTRQISLGIAGDAALTLPLNQAHLISGNLAVATVSADGIVTGVGAGQTTITAIFG